MRSVRALVIAFEHLPSAQLGRRFATKPSFFPAPVNKRHIPNVSRILLVGSGKGGVGKSTVSVNLAVTLAARCGLRVGLLDADVHGPSIPHLMNLQGVKPQLTNSEPAYLLPLENHGIKCMSMGSLVNPSQAIVWRGPMVGKALEQLLFEVVWGTLDVLLVDMPPGTGDTHISLAQRLHIDGAITVTTPQEVALSDVVRSMEMLKKMKIPMVGIVENMSYYVCPGCKKESHLFGSMGGDRLARESGLPLLARLPLDPLVMQGSDDGAPVCLTMPTSPVSQQYAALAAAVQQRLASR